MFLLQLIEIFEDIEFKCQNIIMQSYVNLTDFILFSLIYCFFFNMHIYIIKKLVQFETYID